MELVGIQFGRLEVIEKLENKSGRSRFRCKCICGNYTIVDGSKLKNGHTRSCGCLKREWMESGKANEKHGMCGTRIYMIWHDMKNRCQNTKYREYYLYGGRGIQIHPEWQTFEPFYAWAMASGYRDDLTIDRKDVNGDYCPENCRWATQQEQQNNRRNNRLITAYGETHTLAEWSYKTGIKQGTIWARLHSGWSAERAVTKNVGGAKRE